MVLCACLAHGQSQFDCQYHIWFLTPLDMTQKQNINKKSNSFKNCWMTTTLMDDTFKYTFIILYLQNMPLFVSKLVYKLSFYNVCSENLKFFLLARGALDVEMVHDSNTLALSYTSQHSSLQFFFTVLLNSQLGNHNLMSS